MVSVLLASGLVHGRLTDRWGPSRLLSEAGAQLADLPEDIAGWKATHVEVSPHVQKIAGAANIISREYRSPAGDDAVRIMIVCGRPGPVSLHPPTVCFTSRGLRQVGNVETVRWERGEFARCVFADPSAETRFTTYWGWSSDGTRWTAPDQPRFAFAHHPRLYKLYILTAVDTLEGLPAGRREFVEALLSALDWVLL